MESLKLVLENNTFFFNNKFYKQIKGTAMGTKVAPTYATLVMGYLEELLYSKVEESMDEETAKHFRSTWKRYLDDCFLIWKSGKDTLNNFYDILNSVHSSISFTMECDQNSIAFLDVKVIKQGTKIETDLYYKSTDTHQYLQFNSCHPRHTKSTFRIQWRGEYAPLCWKKKQEH